MDMSSVALLSSAALAAGAYLNAKLSIGTDLKQLRNDREWLTRLMARMQELGDTCTLYAMFQKCDPQADALWFEGRTWTYAEVKTDVDRLAAFLHAGGVTATDFVAVFMTNSPEIVITILALSKLGAVAALINTNLRDATLQYCLKVSTAQAVISTPDLSEFVTGYSPHYSLNLYGFPKISMPSNTSITPLTHNTLPTNPPQLAPAKKAPKDVAILIYTSGTTGKPKACAIRNQFLCVVSNPLPQDVSNPSKYFPVRTYCALPLFHGTANFTGIAYSFGTSGTLCISRKFSSSRFWKEVTESGATRVLYVGELCRYLISSPPSPYDKAHKCIVASGNGLRAEVWDKFKERFNVPEVREFYRSTEGIAKFDNFGAGGWGVGKVGFAGPLGRYSEKDTFLIKRDPDTGEAYRDPKTGFCVRADLNEPGEAIGRVKDRGFLTEYLNNEAATEEKLMRDVFQKGDIYQRTGDLLMHESTGWIKFHDRTGDTFRWKGENVSAGEIRDHIAKLPGVQDCLVYGVKLASYDGQAGAAAIKLESVSEEQFLAGLYAGLKKVGVPAYAIPRLVRITEEIGTGVTFKQAKGDFAKKSWKADSGDKDILYWLDGTTYKKLDGESWAGIESGKAKL